MKIAAAFAAVTLLFSASLSLAQETFRDEDFGFNLTTPAGYKRVDDATLEKFPISPPQGGDAAYLAAFSRSGKLTPPYILIEARMPAWSIADASPKEIQNRLKLTPLQDLVKSGQFDSRHRYKGDNLSPAAFDESRSRILVQGITAGGDGQPLYLYSTNYLAADGMVRINCFAPAQEADSAEKVFEQTANSFVFDPGAAYEPPAPPTRSRYRWGRRGGLGGGVAIVIGLVVWLMNRD